MRGQIKTWGGALTWLAVAGFLAWLFQFWWIVVGGVGLAMWVGASQWPTERVKAERVTVAWGLEEPREGIVLRLIGGGFRPQAEIQVDGESRPIVVPIGALTFLSWRRRFRHLLPRRFYE